MQRRFIATTCQVNEFFPGIALYLIYKTLKIAWLHIQVVSSNRAPRIERLYFSSTNKECLSSLFGRGSHMRGAGYRYTRLWKANQSITGGQWPWKFTWRSSSPLLFWRCFCCASTCIFIFIYGMMQVNQSFYETVADAPEFQARSKHKMTGGAERVAQINSPPPHPLCSLG